MRFVKFGKEVKCSTKLTSVILPVLKDGEVTERPMRKLSTLILLLLFSASGLSAQKTVFQDVKIRRHRSADKRVLVDRLGTLTFDDSAHKLIFKGDFGDRIEVGYDDVEKVVSEVTTHMRGGGVSRAISFVEFPFGAMAGSLIGGVHVNSHWLYLRYRNGGDDGSVLIEAPEGSSDQIVGKAAVVFGSRMTVTNFPEKATDVKLADLKGLKSKQGVKVDEKNHPLPEAKPDKATVVVVCPTLAAHRIGSGSRFRLFADDDVIAVNRLGTYSFAYLDPGRYRLVSQQQNASGFEIDLEPGQRYFFLQNTFQNGLSAAETVLSRNSPELVGYLLDGSYFSDWKPKEK